ncbi:MAG: hypothetical protein JO157_00775 [Acetobacteraceae bacterium]|nr:hypothetical protein [Acetobacteraceae bacterium]
MPLVDSGEGRGGDDGGRARLLDEFCASVARIKRQGATSAPPGAVLWIDHPALDEALPGNGPALGALHKVVGTGPDAEHGQTA